MFLLQLPVLVACVAGLIVVVASWKKSPSASLWAVLGFALALALCFLVPLGQQILWRFMQDAEVVTRAKATSALGFLWSMLRAVTYVLLLIAVYTGRRPAN
jgi:membrane-bound metal-dependent hydrolase YbcI (DUF457 family)